MYFNGLTELGAERLAQCAIDLPEAGEVVFVLVIEDEDALRQLVRRL